MYLVKIGNRIVGPKYSPFIVDDGWEDDGQIYITMTMAARSLIIL